VSDGIASCPICAQHAVSISGTETLPSAKTAASPEGTLLQTGQFSDPPRVVDFPAVMEGHFRYRVLERVGSGGMGTVYRAEHRLMGRIVALKVINQDLVTDPLAVERFKREMAVMARLMDSNIVGAYDADMVVVSLGERRFVNLYFIVMEYVQGVTLAQFVSEHGPLPVAKACVYIGQTAAALWHAHRSGHIHGDIKPQNLMLATPDWGVPRNFGLAEVREWVKVVDFGLAGLMRAVVKPRPVEQTSELQSGNSLTVVSTQDGVIVGTPDYMAPENTRNPYRGDQNPYRGDHRCDFYSLGCTFYYLLTGHVPFPGGSLMDKIQAHQNQVPLPVSAYRSDVPVEVITILERLMAKQPEDRYQTADEVFSAIERLRKPQFTSGVSMTSTLFAAEPKRNAIRRWIAKVRGNA